MDLQETLDKSGYTQAAEDLENVRQMYRIGMENLHTIFPEKKMGILADLAEMSVWIKNAETALAAEYAETVKMVDAHNDLDFVMLDLEERKNLVIEHMDNVDPAKADELRAIYKDDEDDK